MAVMSTRELFDFIVDPSLAEDQIDDYLEKVLSLQTIIRFYQYMHLQPELPGDRTLHHLNFVFHDLTLNSLADPRENYG